MSKQKLKDMLTPVAYAFYLADQRERRRKYRREHPDRVMAARCRYWEKRAAQLANTQNNGDDEK